jgi:hypothetical protein
MKKKKEKGFYRLLLDSPRERDYILLPLKIVSRTLCDGGRVRPQLHPLQEAVSSKYDTDPNAWDPE